MQLLKSVAARLPNHWQTELKRLHFGRQVHNGDFVTDEPEFKLLDRFIGPGNWVIDVGANVGHYTKRFSDLVGAGGRVIAFEPVPTTFSLLSGNVQLFAQQNVTLFNAAVSDKLDVVGMSMPTFETGLANYYQAHISGAASDKLRVLTMALDSLGIDHPISLVKIDAEGHEPHVLAGMRKLIAKSHPVLIVETGSQDVIADLTSMGYRAERLPNSPNMLFRPVA